VSDERQEKGRAARRLAAAPGDFRFTDEPADSAKSGPGDEVGEGEEGDDDARDDA
jgi:hypothetical protein